MAVLSYLAKLKRDLGLPFGAYFLHDFSMKMTESIEENIFKVFKCKKTVNRWFMKFSSVSFT